MPRRAHPQPTPTQQPDAHPPAPPAIYPAGHRSNPWPTVRIDSWQLFWVIVFANLATSIIAGVVVALILAGS